jgi:hypothetical protein
MSTPSENVVTIKDESGTVTGMTYVNGSAVVTKDQQSEPPPGISQSGRVFTITFRADRQNSADVADKFTTSSGGSAYQWTGRGGAGTPNELNFYFSVEITFSTAQGEGSTKVNLGQGHHPNTNNWWIGGSAITSSVPNLSLLVGKDGKQLTVPLSGGTSDFTFGPGTVK